MVERKPLRPRTTSKDTAARTVDRVALDIVDLRVIEAELAAVGPLTITSKEFDGEASAVDSFTEHDVRSVHTLTMRASDPESWRRHLTVDIDRDRAFILVSDDTDHVLAGVQSRVEQICRARSRRYARWASWLIPAFFLAASFSFFLLAFLASRDSFAPDGELPVVWLAIPLGLFLFAAALAVVSWFGKGMILLVSRAESPGWFKRNRDDLLVQVLGGALLLCLGLVIGRLT